MKHLSWRHVGSMSILFLLIISAGAIFAHPAAQDAVTCPGFMLSRLVVGEKGRVGPGGANNMRSEASKNGQNVGQIPGGAEFIVLEGPVCADGLAWWRVDYNGIQGWTAEGSGADYWLEPAGALPTQAASVTPLPATATPSAFACPGFLPSRLIVGEQGRVVPGPSNNLRAEPASGTQVLAEMPGGATFLVMEGPLCQAGLAWWKVNYYGTIGWTAEGSKETYWLEPAGPVPTQAPTLTPTITNTPRPTFTPSPTSTPVPAFPPVGGIIGRDRLLTSSIPVSRTAITTSNVNLLSPLAIFGHGGVNQIAASPNGHTIAVLNSIGLWLNETDTPDQLGRFIESPIQVITALAFSPDGHVLATGGLGCVCGLEPTLQLWNVDTNQTLPEFKGFTDPIYSLAFSPDGRWLGVGGVKDSRWRVWLVNLETGSWDEIINYDYSGSANNLVFSPDSTLLAAASSYGSIRVWSLVANKQQISYEVQGDLGDVMFSPDGAYLLVAGGGGESSTPGVLRIWNLATGERVNTPHFERDFLQMTATLDRKTLAILPYGDGRQIWLWDVVNNQRGKTLSFPDSMSPAKVIVFAPDGRLVVAHQDGMVRYWTTDTVESQDLFDYTGNVGKTALNADGSLLAIASRDNSGVINLWNTTTRELIGTFDQAIGYVSSMAFDQDSTQLVFTVNNTPYIWNLQTGNQSPSSTMPATPLPNASQETFNQLAQSFYSFNRANRVGGVYVVPGNQVMVVSEGFVLTFWDIHNRLPLTSIRYFGSVLGFSADGTVMMTQTDDSIWLWAVPG